MFVTPYLWDEGVSISAHPLWWLLDGAVLQPVNPPGWSVLRGSLSGFQA